MSDTKATHTPASGSSSSSSSEEFESAVSFTSDGRKVIKFYGERNPYGCFSNFSSHPFELHGKQWPTTEHYFQAQKFVGTPMEEKIRLASTPGESKKLGQSRKVTLRADWEQVKDDLMYECVMAKFSQHDNIRRTLLNTEDALLVEHTSNDRYWGDGGDGSGKNMLGKILMRVRDNLREQQQQ
ncbi:GTP cyclohydrolase II, putative [Acanthamoeba castellanii str. Neff]|uniref:GTP cyclohydrolase II, putative n=1 Tax=Acanthamoeba castellanii (strain ATCC 30010 / Neff) TaxID=1257118 RepID=L8HMW5_ACACF|nr:GTP cyclohydrolase II, putative [Acanthamoeba castellanii str. Neff]ELR25746.1 GTP cyclohydrolase II, putative [Acanthamoeba castellanii str. Neff]